jgi:Zn-dependent protease
LSAEVEERLVFFACLFLAIILHEISHGIVALFFGDDTAKRAGRLTLNPIPHIDPFGSIILPAMLTITGFGAFGWAKPVPVDPGKLRNPRREMLFVGLAGPLSNFALMVVAALAARAAFGAYTGNAFRIADLPLVIQVLLFFALANLILGLFNLLPIPPLDGGRIAVGLLPLELARRWAQLERYGIVLVIVVVFLLPHVIQGFDPFGDALDTVVPWAINLLLRLSGHDIGGTDVHI